MTRDLAPAGFHVIRSIASAAFFTVFEVANDEESVRGICKRLTSRAVEDDDARASLAREAAIGARLFAAGAPVAEVVASGDDADGPFLVTEFVEGATLRTLQPSDVTLALAGRAFVALDAVHLSDVVHGDVHLDNLLLTSDSRVVVLDFGLSTIGAAPAASAFRGTAMYAAPEVARGEAFDASADRFSLAAALLHHASGTPPRRGVTQGALLFEAGTAPLDAWLAEISRGAVAELARALSPYLRFDREARAVERRDKHRA